MGNRDQFYSEEVIRIKEELKGIKTNLTKLGILRMSVFLITCTLAYFFVSNTMALMSILVIGAVTFGTLVTKHTDSKRKKKLYEALLEINETEIAVANGNWSNLANGTEFINANHVYSYDIDLFGEGSFFQFINRTATTKGSVKLAQIITENSIDDIVEKQEAIKELANLPKWRQYYTALATITKTEVKPRAIVDWLQSHQGFVPKIFQYIPLVFSLCSTGLIIATFLGAVSLSTLSMWFLLGIGITSRYIKKINKLYNNANTAGRVFEQVALLLGEIEELEVSAKVLKEKKEALAESNKEASKIVKEFAKILDAFDQRNNMLFGFFANGFLLWDLKQCYKIERWMTNYVSKVGLWFEGVTYFDAQNSLANFAYNHPEFAFPSIAKERGVLNSKNLSHPLLSKETRVVNDFNIEEQEFFIITGANMAGKSTFLRTISLNIVMANIGLPVCATSCTYSPIKLITSMRTSDSLKDNESYFFSELKRLKFIVNEIQEDDYFIILDEILKGTNSQDKAIGSKKFVERLVASNSTGIIATHDLSLCEIEQLYPQVKNYYFDAEIIDDELHFDYLFKRGVCKNMNASFLLKKLEIV